MSEKKGKNWQKIKEDSELEIENGDFSEDEISDKHVSAALDHPSYRALEEKLTLAEQKAHENLEKYVRATAELDNVIRRAEKQVADAHLYGLTNVMNSVLPVGDSLDQALQQVDKETQGAMFEGLALVRKQFLDALEKHGAQQFDPLGENFNPQEHEAMSIQDVEGAKPNSILAVFQKGYKLNGRVIRPARVIVAKARATDGNT